ncbi:c-type cytochrome [Sulfurovum sp. zt1-1]|uniref:C-type cytochrome n=1 Tax=Sulfurovum zhangzhouensis TaxID=3019067 RepID=A0ABT7QYB4_9BACT|nr:c-type cytochrome [Sulfurovum zhangzhouensis]MDM5271825.1 c-type cytochrome [Sulfurovum zhangzhouensis]
MKKLAIAMLLAGATSLMADGAAIFAKCVGCHGANAEKSALNKSAIIKGQDTAKTVEQLNAYKAGTLNQYGMGGLMKGQVAALSDEDIQAVSEYIAGLK